MDTFVTSTVTIEAIELLYLQ